MPTEAVEMVMETGLSMVIILLVHHTLAVHNHPVTNNRTMHTGINHTVLGVLVEMDLNMVVEVLEVVKVSL